MAIYPCEEYDFDDLTTEEQNVELEKMLSEAQTRIKGLENIKLLAEKHMFFFTKIMMHRSESEKCKKKKCLVCAELELQDTAAVINLMNAISKLEEG